MYIILTKCTGCAHRFSLKRLNVYLDRPRPTIIYRFDPFIFWFFHSAKGGGVVGRVCASGVKTTARTAANTFIICISSDSVHQYQHYVSSHIDD